MSSVRGLAARCVFAVVIAFVPARALAQTVNAVWDLSPARDAVTSYDVCVGTNSLTCDDVRWSTPPTQNWFSFTATRGVLHFLTVRAVSSIGAGPFAPELRVSTPRLSSIGDRNDVIGATVAADLAVTDPDNSGVSFTATSLPPGIVIDNRSGRLSGRPTMAGAYRPTVVVSDAYGSDAQSFAWTVAAGGGTTPAGSSSPMTSVALSFTPVSPQPAGTAVVISAQGVGGSGPAMYRFWVQPWGGQWQIVQDWSASATYTWRPTAGGYNLSVSGRTGTTGDGVGDYRTFDVTTGGGGATSAPTGGTGGGSSGGATTPMTGVTFAFTPSTPQPVGVPVIISAQGQGGSGAAMYKFWIQPWGGQWQLVQDWTASSTYRWTPRVAGGYNISVYARTGSSGDGVGTSQNVEVRR